MANLWLDLKGPILADTVYIGGHLPPQHAPPGCCRLSLP